MPGNRSRHGSCFFLELCVKFFLQVLLLRHESKSGKLRSIKEPRLSWWTLGKSARYTLH
jgi:hypothetical protein